MSDDNPHTVINTTTIHVFPDFINIVIGIIILIAVFWWTDAEVSFTKHGDVGIYMEFGEDSGFNDD